MVRPARSAEWPVSVRRRDGRVVPFDPARIEVAISRAAHEAGHPDPNAARVLAGSVADALARQPRGEIPTVEQIQDLVEAQLRLPVWMTLRARTLSTASTTQNCGRPKH